MIHRDLKSDNILIDEHGRLLLTDFGCSFVAPGRTLAESQESLRVGCCVEGVGAPEYWAPEVVAAHKSFEGQGEDGTVKMYGRKADMWALGLVLLEIYLGQVCFLVSRCYQFFLFVLISCVHHSFISCHECKRCTPGRNESILFRSNILIRWWMCSLIRMRRVCFVV